MESSSKRGSQTVKVSEKGSYGIWSCSDAPVLMTRFWFCSKPIFILSILISQFIFFFRLPSIVFSFVFRCIFLWFRLPRCNPSTSFEFSFFNYWFLGKFAALVSVSGKESGEEDGFVSIFELHRDASEIDLLQNIIKLSCCSNLLEFINCSWFWIHLWTH